MNVIKYLIYLRKKEKEKKRKYNIRGWNRGKDGKNWIKVKKKIEINKHDEDDDE